ncbi:hypothetical protein CAAN1_30S00716 [[Candida] anglica]|uniref:Uncharacterized protein n=1 Tax=[Candida] anglica TaxID=148631 RepID=A0ABP0EFB3_9ASCO
MVKPVNQNKYGTGTTGLQPNDKSQIDNASNSTMEQSEVVNMELDVSSSSLIVSTKQTLFAADSPFFLSPCISIYQAAHPVDVANSKFQK